MTLTELAGLILAIGSVSGVIIYLLNRNIDNRNKVASITKTNKEIEQIEQDIESKYALQVRDWLEDLEEIKTRHDIVVTAKNAEITKLHTQYLLAIKDITEQKLRLDRFNKATRRILVNMDVPYWECDQDGLVTYVNGAWLKLFGLKHAEALGQSWISAVPEEERANLLIEWNSRIVDHSESSIEFNVLNSLTQIVTRVKSLYVIIFDSEDNIFKVIGVTVELPKYSLQNT